MTTWRKPSALLKEFVTWHSWIGTHSRDSLFAATGGRIRPECLTRDWSSFFRQYAGERTQSGKRLIHINAMCSRPTDFPGIPLDHSSSWWIVNDGGDCYFQAIADLSSRQVIRFSVSGPYPRRGGCP
jgi:hypothetical protein